jgi:hypothetical protein
MREVWDDSGVDPGEMDDRCWLHQSGRYCRKCFRRFPHWCECDLTPSRPGWFTGKEIVDNPALYCEFIEKRGLIPV